MLNIHEIIAEQTSLITTYAEDGAFHSAARVARDLAATIAQHAERCRLAEEGTPAPKKGTTDV